MKKKYTVGVRYQAREQVTAIVLFGIISLPFILHFLKHCLWGKSNPIVSCTSDVILMSEENSPTFQR